MSALLHTGVCTCCKEQRPRDQFGKWVQGREGLHTYCKACMSAKCKARYQANPEPYKARAVKWHAENPEKAKAAAERAAAAYRQRHTERAYEATRRWVKANKEVVAGYHRTKKAKRRAVKSLSSWNLELDRLAFTEAADLCRLRELLCGGSWQVDHVVPLLCKEACGLHNAYNLAVVPSSYNSAKRNSLVPQRGFVVELRP